MNEIDKAIFADARVRVEDLGALWKLYGACGTALYWPKSGRAFTFGRRFTPTSPEALARALASGRIRMPVGARKDACRGCGEVVWWVTTSTGKQMPVDADGQSHFSTCPQANQFRRQKAS